MSFSASGLLLASLLYLILLFGIAWFTERGMVPRRWVRHPLVYVLSLGVYAGIWAVYGAVGMAAESGYGFLAYYLGISGAFLLAPVLLNPVMRIGRAYQLTSLADLFAYRYRSQWAGTLVTLCSGGAILALAEHADTGRRHLCQHSCAGHIACGNQRDVQLDRGAFRHAIRGKARPELGKPSGAGAGHCF